MQELQILYSGTPSARATGPYKSGSAIKPLRSLPLRRLRSLTCRRNYKSDGPKVFTCRVRPAHRSTLFKVGAWNAPYINKNYCSPDVSRRMPGPIVVEIVTFLMKWPFDAAGFNLPSEPM